MLARVPAPLRPAVELGRRCLERFVELEGFDRGMALAGQAFAALLPLLIVGGTAYPSDGRDVADTLIREFNLSGYAADARRGVVPSLFAREGCRCSKRVRSRWSTNERCD